VQLSETERLLLVTKKEEIRKLTEGLLDLTVYPDKNEIEIKKKSPVLGFLHSEQFGKPSLVCDFQELYRFLIDDFVIQYCQGLMKRDFTFKTEKMSAQKKGKREYLDDVKTKDFTTKLYDFFESSVEIPRMKIGKKQSVETLINEECLLFAKYLRVEKKNWFPRIAGI
jgi:CRISPR/Cas system-associated endonuclease Cas1